MKEATVSLYQDTRRGLENGDFPIKLRVYFHRAKLYDTGISMSKDEFKHAYLSPFPRGRYKRLQIKLKAIESKAIEALKQIKDFSFYKFERQVFKARSSVNNVFYYFNEYIELLESEERIGSASNYISTVKSLKEFCGLGRKNLPEKVEFDFFDVNILNKYERWMLGRNLKRTTVGIYLRALRRIFNLAIENADIPQEIYPFKKYKIPTGRNIKKNLSSDIMKSLLTADLMGDEFIEKARDFWFFSYQCNGMNIRDVAELKFRNLGEGYFSFLRKKTYNTTKSDPRPIVVPITSNIAKFFLKYGIKNGQADDYVFPIFSRNMDAKEKYRVNMNFVRFINQHMVRLGKRLGIPFNIGTMHARHSFTTRAVRLAGLEFAQEALGHTTIITTQNYWAGFENEAKIKVAEQLMDFG